MHRSQDPPIRFVLASLAALLVMGVISAIFHLGSIPLAVSVVVIYVAFAIYGIRIRDHIVWLWLLFGLVTGLVEVVSDCDYFLVIVKQVLIYPSDVPKIGVSPAYLPFAWGLIFTFIGYIGDWIRQRHSLLKASVLTAALGAVLITLFENLARPAGWWYYQNTPKLIEGPYFVAVFEFLSTILFVLIAWRMATAKTIKAEYGWAIAAGVGMGIWMCVAMRFAFWLVGACQGSVIQLPC